MIEVAILIFAVIILLFGFVIIRGAPYLPTLRQTMTEALDMLDLQPGETLLELGSGDGRLLRLAAEKGIYAIGYELNPLLVLWSRLRHWRYRKFITVKWGDFWLSDWPPSDGMYVFLLERYMDKLHTRITRYKKNKPYKVVSNSFQFPGVKSKKQSSGLFLYTF